MFQFGGLVGLKYRQGLVNTTRLLFEFLIRPPTRRCFNSGSTSWFWAFRSYGEGDGSKTAECSLISYQNYSNQLFVFQPRRIYSKYVHDNTLFVLCFFLTVSIDCYNQLVFLNIFSLYPPHLRLYQMLSLCVVVFCFFFFAMF